MIKRIKVTGYTSLKDVEVQFQPLSIMFGPNAAGKSNLLDALSLVSGIVTKKNLKEAFAEKLILEKRKGMDTDGNPKKRITEKYLRYSVTIQILPKTGYLRIKLECADTKQCNQEISQRLY